MNYNTAGEMGSWSNFEKLARSIKVILMINGCLLLLSA
jgi:hypothetical protein